MYRIMFDNDKCLISKGIKYLGDLCVQEHFFYLILLLNLVIELSNSLNHFKT